MPLGQSKSMVISASEEGWRLDKRPLKPEEVDLHVHVLT